MSYDGPGDLEDVQLAVTRSLIDYDNQSIVIIRPAPMVLQPDKSLKRVGSPTTLLPQHLFFSGVTADDAVEVEWDGQKVISRYVLIGMPDADIKENDRFELWGRNWKVIQLHPDTRWQKKAWVLANG